MNRIGLIAAGFALCSASCLCCVGQASGHGTPLPKIRVAAGGRAFETEDGKPFVALGVNYFRPGTGWAPQLWQRFDAEATRRDFTVMKRLGVNCVRVFISFGSFFTERDRLEPEGLDKFDQFLRIAEKAGIYVHPTGPDHWEGVPAWAAGDRIAEEQVLAALETFWRLFAKRYRARNVLFAYDLRNEPRVPWDTPPLRARWNRYLAARYGSAVKLARAWHVDRSTIHWNHLVPPPAKQVPGDPRLLDYQHFRETMADRWTRRQVDAIKSVDPAALVTVGLIQWSIPIRLSNVRQYSGFRPARQAKLLDFLTIHFYPLANGFYDYVQPADEERNLAYLESVVGEVAAAGQPVVVGEFGWYGGGKLTIDRGAHPAANEQQQANWCRLVVETSEGLATGWLNWGLYDTPEARDVSQLTGLLAADGRPKAWAGAFQRLAATLTSKPFTPVPPGPRPVLDWDRCITSIQAGREFQQQYYESFRARANPAGGAPSRPTR